MKRVFLVTFTMLGVVLLASSKADLTAPTTAAPAPPQDAQSFTMLFSSDPQYPWWRNGEEFDPLVLSKAEETNTETVRAMNAIQNLYFLEGQNTDLTPVNGRWPLIIPCKTLYGTACQRTPGQGGLPVTQPAGLIINGDLTNFFHKRHWEGFLRLYYGIFSSGVQYPLYLGLGNHDYKNNVSKVPGVSSGAFGSWGDGNALIYAYDYDRNGKEAVWHMAEILDGNPRVSNLDLNSYVSVKNASAAVIRFFLKYRNEQGLEVSPGSGAFPTVQRRGIVFPRGTPVGVEIQVSTGSSWYTTAVLTPPVKGAACFEATGLSGNIEVKPVACIHERPTGSAGSLSYSFDIGNYHFVQLHYRPDYEYDMPERTVTGPVTTYGLDESPGFTVTNAYNWLRDDLIAATAEGKAIVLNMHDALAGDCTETIRLGEAGGFTLAVQWMPCGQTGTDTVLKDQRFKDVIKNRNVVAIFAGHLHDQYGLAGFTHGRNGANEIALTDGSRQIPVFLSGSAEYRRFLVVDFHPKHFAVGVVNSSLGVPNLVTDSQDEAVPDRTTNHDSQNTTSPIVFSINRPPTVSPYFDGQATPLEGSPVQFHADGADPDSDPLTYTWTFKNDLDQVIGTRDGADPVFAFPDGDKLSSKTYTVTVTADDGYDAGLVTQEFKMAVKNVAPTVTVTGMTIDENGDATVTGTITDPGVEDSFTLSIVWEGPEKYTFDVLPKGTKSFSRTYKYLDDNPTGTPADNYTVRVTVRDKDDEFNGVDVTMTVRNVNPAVRSVEVRDDANNVVGESDPVLTGLTLASHESYTDVGTRDTLTATRDWGDGTPIENLGLVPFNPPPDTPGTSGAHAYQQAGEYRLKVSVQDDDTGASFLERRVRVVTPAGAMMQAIDDLSRMTSSSPTATHALADAVAALNGNNAGAANNGALDQLAKGNETAALVKLEESIGHLETAEAIDPALRTNKLGNALALVPAPTSPLIRIKSLLTLTAKSVAVQAIARAEAAARNNGQLQQVAAAKALLAQGQSLLINREYTAAVRKFRDALSKTSFAKTNSTQVQARPYY